MPIQCTMNVRNLICRTLSALLLCVLAPSSFADFITGQVVDSNGVGVQGVDIDVKNLRGGGDPTIFNDGTDAGGFFTTTLPAGFYRITFTPPKPPVTTHLIQELDNIVVVGTTNLGVVTLDPGIALSGTALDAAGFPVANINLDVIDNVTGQDLTLIGDTTDAFGNFNLAVPANSIEVQFKTTGVTTQTLAPMSLDLSPTADLNLGNLIFQAGFNLTGTVIDFAGFPVAGADLDAVDVVTKSKLFTPNDNTDASGNFSFVVPAGVYDVDACPPSGASLVGVLVTNVSVTADTSIGTLVMVQGVTLFGTILGFDGLPVAGADVDLNVPVTGESINLNGDNTDASGAYSVLVPIGTFDVNFEPPGFSLPLGSQTLTNFSISGATLLDGTLPSCPFGVNYGTGSPGTGGVVPHITTSGGAPRVDNSGWALELESGRGGSLAVLMIGLGGPSGIPYSGGTILVNILDPSLMLIGVPLGGTPGAAGAGSGTFPFAVPPTVAGISAWCQFGVLDPGIPFIVALSDGVQVDFCE